MRNGPNLIVRSKKGFYISSKRSPAGGCSKCLSGGGITIQPFPVYQNSGLVANSGTLSQVGPNCVIPNYGTMGAVNGVTAVAMAHKRKIEANRDVNMGGLQLSGGYGYPQNAMYAQGISGVPGGILGNTPGLIRNDIYNVGNRPRMLSGYSPFAAAEFSGGGGRPSKRRRDLYGGCAGMVACSPCERNQKGKTDSLRALLGGGSSSSSSSRMPSNQQWDMDQ